MTTTSVEPIYISETLTIPPEGFNVILTDFPWAYRDKLDHPNMRGGAESQYPVLKPLDLAVLDLGRLAAKDCAFFMWTTGPQMDVAIDLFRAYSFEFKTIAFVWRKMNKKATDTPFYGLGRLTRSNYEYVLYGTRGKPKRVDKGVRQEIEHPITRHSAKPPIVRKMIDKLMGPCLKVELFARDPEPGWQGTGLELDGIDIRDVL